MRDDNLEHELNLVFKAREFQGCSPDELNNDYDYLLRSTKGSARSKFLMHYYSRMFEYTEVIFNDFTSYEKEICQEKRNSTLDHLISVGILESTTK